MKSKLFIFSSMLVGCLCQRPSYAGKSPIGYPTIQTTTSTASTDLLGNRFGQSDINVTTERLPLEALGDRDLVNRLSKLPLDKQPFWLLNWRALEEQRKNPQSYSPRPVGFVDPLSNVGSQISQGGQMMQDSPDFSSTDTSESGTENNFGSPNSPGSANNGRVPNDEFDNFQNNVRSLPGGNRGMPNNEFQFNSNSRFLPQDMPNSGFDSRNGQGVPNYDFIPRNGQRMQNPRFRPDIGQDGSLSGFGPQNRPGLSHSEFRPRNRPNPEDFQNRRYTNIVTDPDSGAFESQSNQRPLITRNGPGFSGGFGSRNQDNWYPENDDYRFRQQNGRFPYFNDQSQYRRPSNIENNGFGFNGRYPMSRYSDKNENKEVDDSSEEKNATTEIITTTA